MLKQKHFTLSRRNFLKSAASASALSIGGLSSLAFATNAKTQAISTNDISVMQQHMLHKEMVSLFNNSDDALILDASQPVTIERVEGSLVVKPNLADTNISNEVIKIEARQRVSFDIQTTGSIYSRAEIRDASKLKGEYLHISSEFSGFNALIPVSSFDASLA